MNTTRLFRSPVLKLFPKGKHTMAVNRDSLHLKEGDAQPALQKGLLRLYNMRFCPFAQRAVLVLDAKKIPYDTVNCNLITKPEWLFQKSDGAKVPAIEFDNGKVLSESLIIADYLDEAYPKLALYPADPLSKALDRRLIDAFGNNVNPILFKMLLVPESELNEANFNLLLNKLVVFEEELTKRDSPFFGGAAPGMLDFMIWPFMERIPLVGLLGGDACKIPADRFPQLTKWAKTMLAEPVVKLSALSPTAHRTYFENRKKGIYDYDLSRL